LRHAAARLTAPALETLVARYAVWPVLLRASVACMGGGVPSEAAPGVLAGLAVPLAAPTPTGQRLIGAVAAL